MPSSSTPVSSTTVSSTPVSSTPVSSTPVSSLSTLFAVVSHTLLKFNVQFNVLEERLGDCGGWGGMAAF